MKKTLTLLFICITHLISNAQIQIHEGTIILTIVTNDSIWIGSDSKTTSRINVANAQSPKTIGSHTSCKIQTYKNINYSISGVSTITNQKQNSIIDIGLEVQRFLSSTKSVTDIEPKLHKILFPKFDSIYRDVARSDINFVSVRLKNNPMLLSVVFSAFQNNKPFCVKWMLRINGNEKKWYLQDTIQNFVNGNTKKRLLCPQGHFEDVASYLSKHKNYLNTAVDMKKTLVDLLSMQMRKDSITIGPPFVVKVLYSEGSKWLTEHPDCQ